MSIPFQREADENGGEKSTKVRLDAQYMDEQRVLLLRDAEQSRVKARERVKLVKHLWVQSEIATKDKRRVADAQNPDVVDAYGGSRATSDPLYKRYASENGWYMTRSQTMALNLICEQNKEIIRLLSKIAGES